MAKKINPEGNRKEGTSVILSKDLGKEPDVKGPSKHQQGGGCSKLRRNLIHDILYEIF